MKFCNIIFEKSLNYKPYNKQPRSLTFIKNPGLCSICNQKKNFKATHTKVTCPLNMI